jgi:hypothetical protein
MNPQTISNIHKDSTRSIRNMETTCDDEKIEALYEKVVKEPQKHTCSRGCIKCPECGEEILMIPTLKVMSKAIENHVNFHKEQLKHDPIREIQKAIGIRLTLMGQVIEKACKLEAS